MRYLWVLGLCGFIFGLSFSRGAGIAAAQTDCGGVTPSLRQGVTARARFDNGIGLTFRSGAGTDASGSRVIDNLPEGTIFSVTGDSPTCRDGFIWWAVRLSDGRSGFISEGTYPIANQQTFVEIYEIGAHIFQPAPANPEQINHFFINSRAEVSQPHTFTIPPMTGTVGSLWQAPEISAANAALANRIVSCPAAVPIEFRSLADLSGLSFEGRAWVYYPNPSGNQLLLMREHLINIPHCDGRPQQFGTIYVSLLGTGNPETFIFPYSQHSDPPLSFDCFPPWGVGLDRATYMQDVKWSQDGRYIALNVRYLRDSDSYPCAFYHVFVIDSRTQAVHYISEGGRVGWGQGGGRLRLIRSEGQDPNAQRNERLLSVLPDGQDRLEIYIPGGATWFAVSRERVYNLPWTERGDKALVCNFRGVEQNCNETLTFGVLELGFDGGALVTPQNLMLNGGSVYFVRGDTYLLWRTVDGALYLQALGGANRGTWREIGAELGISGVQQVEVLPTGIGAALRLSSGAWLYLDLVNESTTPIVGLSS